MLPNGLLLAVLILTINVSIILCGVCPTDNSFVKLIQPCFCRDDTISCGGTDQIDLKAIFQNISKNIKSANDKHFYTFYLNNTKITELVQDVFADISFQVIDIETDNLSRIHSKAFTASNLHTVYFKIIDRSFGSDTKDHNIFEALSQMINLETVYLSGTKIRDIPAKAFHSGDGTKVMPNKLKELYIVGGINSIGDYAFSQLNNLLVIDLAPNGISHISEHAFDFVGKSDKLLYIKLYNNPLNTSSFDLGAFSRAQRPLRIDLRSNRKLTYLDEKVFAPLLSKTQTILEIEYIPFVCDCKMQWVIIEKAHIEDKVRFGKCSDGTPLFDLKLSHFENC
jgi:Leucine-rich repeat (LRR) protein